MVNKDLGPLTQEELAVWDAYAAAALSGIFARTSASSGNLARKAAEAADSLLLERRLRGSEE
jgi:hypothetical protein